MPPENYKSPMRIKTVSEEDALIAEIKRAEQALAELGKKLVAAKKAKEFPAAPRIEISRFTFNMRFAGSAKVHEYLALRHNGMWYTTGTGDDAKFSSWGNFVAWVQKSKGAGSVVELWPLTVPELWPLTKLGSVETGRTAPVATIK